MEKMRWKLEWKCESENPCLITYGCGVHSVNLVRKDTPSTIIKHIVEVYKYFQNPHASSVWLKEYSEYVLPQLLGSIR